MSRSKFDSYVTVNKLAWDMHDGKEEQYLSMEMPCGCSLVIFVCSERTCDELAEMILDKLQQANQPRH